MTGSDVWIVSGFEDQSAGRVEITMTMLLLGKNASAS